MPVPVEPSLITAFKAGQTVFHQVVLREANLAGAHLPFIQLEQASLKLANLRNACLPGANLSGALLTQASLEHANLLGCDLDRADLNQASLDYALMGSANLEEANLNSASLMGASLSNACLKGANLRNANLMGANLIGADLSYANLFGAKAIHSALKDATLKDTIMPDGSYYTLDKNTLQQRQKRLSTRRRLGQSLSEVAAESWKNDALPALDPLPPAPSADQAPADGVLIFYGKSPSDGNRVYAFRVDHNSADLTLCAVDRHSTAWDALKAARQATQEYLDKTV